VGSRAVSPSSPAFTPGDAGLGVAGEALREIITGFLDEVRFA
jgi:hypothetical protein